MGYKFNIGSFNLYKYSYKSDNEIRKDIRRIASIIRDDFDVVALQEVFSESAFKLLLRALGGNWEGRWASPKTSIDANKDSAKKPMNSQAAEGYAFLWKKRRFKLFEQAKAYGKKISEPRIYSEYSVDKRVNRLLRDPMWIRLVPVHGPYIEIRLFNTHIRFSKDGASEQNDDMGQISGDAGGLSRNEARKQELNVLIKEIMSRNNGGNASNRPVYCFLVGDYNLNIDRPGNDSPYLPEVVMIQDGKATMRYVTVQSEKTTLKQPSSVDGTTIDKYSSNYDHFTYDEHLMIDIRQLKIEPSRIDTLSQEWCENQNVAKHRQEVSDHVPIKLRVTIG